MNFVQKKREAVTFFTILNKGLHIITESTYGIYEKIYFMIFEIFIKSGEKR